MPGTAEINISNAVSGTQGFSLTPAATVDPNIVLTRSAGSAAQPVVAATAGFSAETIAFGAGIQSLQVGATPQVMGSIPVTSAIIIPDPASMSVLESELNTFAAEVPDVEIKPAQDVPAMDKIPFGTQPNGGNEPVE